MSNERGFTLIEMLIVLLIITVLILLILPNMADKTKTIHREGCDALVHIVSIQNILKIKNEKRAIATNNSPLVEGT